MCLICIDYEKGKLTIFEAAKNLHEVALGAENLTEEEREHAISVANDLIAEAEKKLEEEKDQA